MSNHNHKYQYSRSKKKKPPVSSGAAGAGGNDHATDATQGTKDEGGHPEADKGPPN